jgi:hypothetical protein
LDEAVNEAAVKRGEPASLNQFALAVNKVRVEYDERGRVRHRRHPVRKQRSKLEKRRELLAQRLARIHLLRAPRLPAA